MGRFRVNGVRYAVKEQMEHLRRASRVHALGIKAACEEPTEGFTQSEDIVISMYIPYCEAGHEWEVIIDADAPQRCPDLIPVPATKAEAGKGFTTSLAETYELYRLSALPSLKSWDLFRRPESLTTLVQDIKRLRREHEIKKLKNAPLPSASFHFAAVADRQDEVEVLVSRSGVRIVFPLWKEPDEDELAAREQADAAEAGPMFVYGRVGIRMRLEWTEVDGKRPDVRIIFPPEAQGLERGFRQPTWTSDMTLLDYLPQAQTAVEKPWRDRKQLVATLAARHSVLEYDAQDFTTVHLFMKVKGETFVYMQILRLDIGPDFPEVAPQMTLCDALSDPVHVLDRRDYLYSPRWDVERMATELYKHAERRIPECV